MSNNTTVSIGDVVLIHDNMPRNQWEIGVVTDLHKGKDGLVRSVSLRISSGNTLLRPIEKTLRIGGIQREQYTKY